jgi:hypothetical protein
MSWFSAEISSVLAVATIASVVTVARLKYPVDDPSANFFSASTFSDMAFWNTGHICMRTLKIKCSAGGHRRFCTSVTTPSDSRIIVNSGMTGDTGSNTDRTNVW